MSCLGALGDNLQNFQQAQSARVIVKNGLNAHSCLDERVVVHVHGELVDRGDSKESEGNNGDGFVRIKYLNVSTLA